VWRDEAACKDADPEIFFEEPRGKAREQQYEAAKAICATCPVVAECLAESLRDISTYAYGVWGGTSPSERQQIAPPPRVYRLRGMP